ncbi:SAM-dependent methyltransferase, partial [Actinomadura adrarensis]
TPPGSALVISHVTSEENRADAADTAENVYKSSTASLALRTRPEIAALLTGYKLDDPGLVYAPEWHPDTPDTVSTLGTKPTSPSDSFLFVAVGHR